MPFGGSDNRKMGQKNKGKMKVRNVKTFRKAPLAIPKPATSRPSPGWIPKRKT